MARFSVLFALFAASVAVAAPLGQRTATGSSLGSIQCNVNRLQIVSSLAGTTKAVGKIDTTDPDTATAVSAAQAGLSSASDGIKAIASSLVSGGAPPADARTQVGTGLTAAQTALTGITDPTVAAAVSDAQTKLATTIKDGEAVVANCN
ncbi:hypothetical protein B0H14DRAFT_2769981 [Mycena olivaceomarginata]|nr:hypothetical protein B0H14DRAFT_2769981 [Mycena olivaceomarginata]